MSDATVHESNPAAMVYGWALMPDAERQAVLVVWDGGRLGGAAVYAILAKAMPRAEAGGDDEDNDEAT